MDDLLASVSEEATLEAQREAAASRGDRTEVRRLDGLIVEAMKRGVAAEGHDDGLDNPQARPRGWGSGWRATARYVGTLGVVLSLLFLSVGPGSIAARAAPTIDAAGPVAAMSSSADLSSTSGRVVASATATTRPTCEILPRPETLPKVGDLIEGGYWAYLEGDSWAYQVTSVDRQKSLQWSKWGYESTAMGVWLITHIRLRNSGNREAMPYPYDFQVMGRDGTSYAPNRQISHLYSDFNQLYTFGTTVPPGVWTELGVVTDISPDAHGLMLCILQAGTIVDLGD
jgi:hypothetical protein